jgi:hypothetical protein
MIGRVIPWHGLSYFCKITDVFPLKEDQKLKHFYIFTRESTRVSKINIVN